MNNKNPVTKSNGRNYKRYGKEIWEKIRIEYENKDISALKLAENWGVSEKSVFWHIKREMWEKCKNLPIIYTTIAERNKKMLIEAGVTEKKISSKLADMLDAEELVFEGKGEAMQATTQPAHKVILEAIKEINKLTAAYPKEDPKEGDKHVHFHLDPEKLKNKSADEVISDYQRLISGE